MSLSLTHTLSMCVCMENQKYIQDGNEREREEGGRDKKRMIGDDGGRDKERK